MAKVDALLDQAADALDAGRFDVALTRAEAALKHDPKHVEALGLRAAALTELGRWEDADAVYAALMAREPKEASWVLAAADLMIRLPGDDPARAAEAFALLDRATPLVRDDERLKFEWLLLRAHCLINAGELEAAVAELDAALKLFPEDFEARQVRAEALLELGRFDEARKVLAVLADEYDDEPAPLHFLGILAERAGDEAEAERLFAASTALDPEGFPPATKLSEAEFDAAVKEAIAKLPDHAKAELGNVTMSVEPFPDDASLGGEVTPLILGVFVGTPLDERSPVVAEHHQTAEIILFQRNLQRFAKTRDELIEQIGITVLHEVGHLLGLDEDELYDRGLD